MADISQIKLPGDSTGRNIKALKLPYGECSTAASTAAKVVSIKTNNDSGNTNNMPFILEPGSIVLVRFTITNTAAVGDLTLNINGTGAKAIKYRNGNLAAAGDLAAGRTYMFTYDGIYWQFTGDFDTKNTTGSTDTSSKIYLVGATSQDVNPQTYSDDEIYATSGVLTTKSVQVGGSAATIQFNSTDNSIEFVFN